MLGKEKCRKMSKKRIFEVIEKKSAEKICQFKKWL